MDGFGLPYNGFDPYFGSPFMQPFLWITVVCAFSAFGVGFFMGANDVANSFGTSVAAKVVNILQACILAGLFNTVGALLLGSRVTETIRKGVIDTDTTIGIYTQPNVLMASFAAAYCGVVFLVGFATWAKMPVSTTHSVIGAIAGSSMVAYGASSIDPWKIIDMVVGWVAAPIFAGIFAALAYWGQKKLVTTVDDIQLALVRQRAYVAFQIGIVMWTLTFFLMTSIIPEWAGDSWPAALKVNKINLFSGKKVQVEDPINGFYVFLIALAVALLLGTLSYFFLLPSLFRSLDRSHARVLAKFYDESDLEKVDSESEPANGTVVKGGKKSVCDKLFSLNHEDEEYALEEFADESAEDARGSADGVALPLEIRFKGVQVLSASFMALAHGASDISNVIGPFLGTIGLFNECNFSAKSGQQSYGVIIFGAIAIVAGLALFGARVMATIAHNTVLVTPSRGVNIEIGAAFSSIIASYIGVPTSTTQCAVGAIVAVGLCNDSGRKAVNWKMCLKIVVAWVLTPVIAGFVAALFMLLFKAMTENQVPSNYFPITENSTLYGLTYDQYGSGACKLLDADTLAKIPAL